jgi:hypothetical protein
MGASRRTADVRGVTLTKNLLKPIGMALLGLSLALTTTGCRERVCSEGEYPVVSDAGAEACVPHGERVPEFYDEYPAGQTPTYVDEIYPDTP